MPWPFSCSKPLDIKKRVSLIPSVCASRLACHSNVQMQLPRFPFGCYTNPDVAWLVCGAPSCTAPLAAGVGHGSSMTLGSPDVKSASGICAPAPIQSHFFAPPLSPPASAGSRCPLAALAAPPRLCRRRARPRALPPARDGSAPRLSAAWTGSGGWVTVARQGFPGVEGLETTGVKTLRGTRKTIRRTGREDCDLQIERLVLCSDHHRRRPLVSGDWTMFSLERRLHGRQAAIEPATLDSPRISFDHRKYRSRNFHCGKCAAGSKHVGGGTNAWGQRANH